MENGGEKIIKINIEEEMKSSYIDYSMSVIVSRALPDVRDGLKPVHRRVLFGMDELGLTSGKPYKKSARIVGEVLGKYHPHGDSSVYMAMVRMAQEWSLRYPLVDGQGNFGSVDGDSPAAMRYTEARMAKITEDMLIDIDKDTVDFVPNYDNTMMEPTLFPTTFPSVLVNANVGIAVSMASNVCPFNLTEVCDTTIALLKNQELSIADTTFSYTALEATYQGDELKTVVKELLEEVKEDSTISHYFAASDLMTEDEFQSNLQEALDNWNDTTVTESATVTLYVDPTGTIRGCRIADPDDADSSLLECYAGKDGKQIGVYFDVNGLNVSGVLSEGSKDTYSGTITAALENHSILLDLEDFKIVDDERGYCSGSLTASTEDEPNLFTLSLDSDGKSQTFSVDWAVGGTNYATISCTLSTDKGDDLALNIPSDSLDLSDDATKDAYFGDGTQTKDCLKKIATALGIQDADNFADSIYDEINGGDDLNTQSSDSDITTLPADSDRPVEDGVETEIPTDTTDTTDSSDNEQRIDADLSIAAITYNGGKLFRFYENNMDLIKLVDCSVDPTIESQDYNWYSNSDATLTLGLENMSTSPTDAQTCNIFEVEVYEGSPSDIRVGVVGIGSSVADLEAQFNVDIIPEAETASSYVVSIYDTVSNGQKAYSFYIENGRVTAFDLVDYS